MTTTPQNLRMQDLIAKTACVTLKDTIRVIHAIEAAGLAYAIDPPRVVDFVGPMTHTRPTPENVAACEQASFEMREGDLPFRNDIDDTLRDLNKFL